MIKFCRLAQIAAANTGVLVRRASVHLVRIFALAGVSWAACAYAQQPARFDLAGPKIDVRVTRGGVTLPIASVPNLQPKDRLWVHPDLPPTQSVRYLMVVTFLRGTTNPPPDHWFIRIPTWEPKVRKEGVEVTVPDEAQQAVLFLAPVTGGDFSTLRSAVQGRPGIFVRASQDLAAAGFEQARIEKYIASMQELSPSEVSDPKQLQEHSNLIASTLALRPNADCVTLAPDQQYTCLTQSGGQSLLDDGHGQSVIDALTGGTSAGLIGTVSSTQLAGGGLYSAYVGSIVDLVHIMGTLHTARYQYIPAIAFPQQQALNLRLNTAPSFHNPKSVIVIGLPSIQHTVPPPLRAADPRLVSCLQKPGVVLPVEGAPLVYSTAFAHDLVLHLNGPAGATPQDIPLIPDAFRGGLVIAPTPERRPLPTPTTATPADASAPQPGPVPAPAAQANGELTGTIKGLWGFDTFVGPTLPLQNTPGKDWKLTGDGPAGGWLIAGKERHVTLTSTGTACIEGIALDPASGGERRIGKWKPTSQPNAVDVALDLPAHDAGEQQLSIRQYGDPKPATINLVSYNEPAKLEALHFHAGDTIATLAGTGLDEVRQLEFGGHTFKPAGIEQGSGKPELHLTLAEGKAPSLAPGDKIGAKVALRDGRTLNIAAAAEPPRPAVTIIGHADVVPESQPSQFHIKLGNDSDLPVSDSLMFSLKSAQSFPRAGVIEIASPEGSLHASLSLSASDAAPEPDPKSSLILEGPQTLLGVLKPLKVFGPSAFGPIRLRAVAPDGTAGDWLPLVTLVRLPTLSRLNCPVAAPVESASAPRHSQSSAHSAAPVTPNPPAANPDAAPAEQGAATPPAAGDTSAPPPTTAGDSGASPKAQAEPKADVPAKPATCTLAGSGLYFIDSIATNSDFTNAVRVPEGFVGTSLTVPPPTGAVYYLRLRDDPSAVDTVSLPAGPL